MQITIPFNTKVLDPNKWKTDKLHIYALAYTCVGISPIEIPEWIDVALHHEIVECRVGPTSIRFKLPDKFYGFYHLMQIDREYSLTANGNIVLMVITTKKE
jgi:hypothetical protein